MGSWAFLGSLSRKLMKSFKGTMLVSLLGRLIRKASTPYLTFRSPTVAYIITPSKTIQTVAISPDHCHYTDWGSLKETIEALAISGAGFPDYLAVAVETRQDWLNG